METSKEHEIIMNKKEPPPWRKKFNKFVDYSSQIFPGSRVIKRIPPPIGMHPGPTYWEIECKCGEKFVRTSNILKKYLESRKKLHCGCLHKKIQKGINVSDIHLQMLISILQDTLCLADGSCIKIPQRNRIQLWEYIVLKIHRDETKVISLDGSMSQDKDSSLN